MNIEELYQVFIKSPLVSTDTRKIKANSIFFALKGENFNGNKFAKKAIEEGCSYAVIDEEEYNSHPNFILVGDVLKTLQELATYHRDQLAIPVIGITGSNGKTTTKELILSVLQQKFNTYATKGNLNNHIGVPLSVLEINAQHDLAIIEMGANHVGEIATLCTISKPSIGLITNIGKAHLDGFGGIEGVIKAKSELYQYLKANNSPVFINGDNELLVRLSAGITKISYGFSEENNIIGGLVNNSDPLKVQWKTKQSAEFNAIIKTHILGRYNFENILCAITIGNYYKMEVLEINEGIATYTSTNNRSQLIEKGSNKIYMDAYNANPVSMKAAIENLGNVDAPKKLAILGDMMELGKYSVDEHQEIIEVLRENNIDKGILIGDEFAKTEHAGFVSFNTVEILSAYFKIQPIEDTLMLVKGSRSIQLERVIEEMPT